MAWVLTELVKNHRRQLDARFPRRSMVSSGTIGDAAHKASTTGHAPDDDPSWNSEWDGDADKKQEVRASDEDKDLNDERGATMEDVVQHYIGMFRAGRWAPFRYIIYKGRIWRKSNGWVTQQYSGPNKHTEHAHFSGDYSDTADEAGDYDFRLNEVGEPMELTTKNLTEISDAVVAKLLGTKVVVVAATDKTPEETWSIRACLGYIANIGRQNRTIGSEIKALVATVKGTADNVLKNVMADDADAAKIMAKLDQESAKAITHANALAQNEAQLLNEAATAANDRQAELIEALSKVDEQILAKLSDPQTPDEQVANALVQLLGSRKEPVLALMQQQ